MKKYLAAVFFALLFVLPSQDRCMASCNEAQTNAYVKQILFGKSSSHSSDEKVEMLLDALYLCSERSNQDGQSEYDRLKNQKIRFLPKLADLDLKESSLLACTHNSWDYEFSDKAKDLKNKQKDRKTVLRKTVNEIFDFGMPAELRGGGKKCDSFAAVLYYSHILADYLADDPQETETHTGGKTVPAYSGAASVTLSESPSFTQAQKNTKEPFVTYSPLDDQGRAGPVFACLSYDMLPPPNSRQDIGSIKPSGWNQRKDDLTGIVNSNPPYLYNRCHLVAHELGGKDEEENLITGTRYLNIDGMLPYENQVRDHLEEFHEHHVLYRSTPVFEGDNLLASGVHLEAYCIEDKGKEISIDVYCYNVQPGVDLDYRNGENKRSEPASDKMLPFAVPNADDKNPDLLYEMEEQFKILFQDQLNDGTYREMDQKIDGIASEARKYGDISGLSANQYADLKKQEYEYLKTLTIYVPLLLKEEAFFSEVF